MMNGGERVSPNGEMWYVQDHVSEGIINPTFLLIWDFMT